LQAKVLGVSKGEAMKHHFAICLVFALGAACSLNTISTYAQSEANRSGSPPPKGFQSFNDPQGTGVALYGTFHGNARSAKAALEGILASLRGYFEGVPKVQVAVSDFTDQHIQAMFSARVQGTSVVGVAAVDLNNGAGLVSLLYDRPESFRYSITRLRGVLAKNLPQGRAQVPLQPITLADGSSISIPAGWRVTNAGKGSVELAGPNGEDIALGLYAPVYSRPQRMPYMPANYLLVAPCCDPVRAYATLFPQFAAALTQRLGVLHRLERIIEAQPVQGPSGQSAYILSEISIGGRPFLSYSLVIAMSGYSDPWTYYTSTVGAPASVFSQEFATMIQVWKSYSINPAVFRERIDNAIKSMNESYKIFREGMAESTRASLSEAEGWDQVIRGVETVEHADTGKRWEVNNSAAQGLVNQLNGTGYGNWRIVPPSELIPRTTP
jgi:hypothetical protein